MSIVQPWLLLAPSAPFVLAIWIAFVHRPRIAGNEIPAPWRVAEAGRLDQTGMRFEAETIELEAAVREVATAIEALARSQWVRIDFAVSAALTVHMDPGVLEAVLREAMQIAIRATPGGQVLVTAGIVGDQLHLCVTDDGSGADQRNREASVRGAAASIALQGGSVAVDARPGRGTTVTMRLPLAVKAEAEAEAGGLTQSPVLAKQAA